MTDQANNEKLPARRLAPSRVERAQSQINLYRQSALGYPGDGAKQPWDKMTVLEALAILEAAVLECKKRQVDTPELRAALDFLEPHIYPTWLIPQFRHNLDGEQQHDYAAREGQQQIFRATFPGIRDSVRALIARRMDALARRFHETKDSKISDEIYRLSRELIKLDEPWVFRG